MAKDRFGYGTEWEDRGYFSRSIQSAPLQLGTGAVSIAHAKWMLDPRRPNQVHAARNVALNKELYNLKPSGTKINFLNNTAWYNQMVPGMGSAFDPTKNTVNVASKFKSNFDPGIFAHELGHAEQFNKGGKFTKLNNKLQTPSRMALGFGIIPQLFADNQETAKGYAQLATLASAPTIINEFDASRRGRNLLKKAAKKSGSKLSFLQSLAPFKGMPSYLLTAALPLLYYNYLNKRGAYKKEGQKTVNRKWGA
tara:strand:+ start:569 stop:1324 length:756 start_codon:yes stop_codon:yes gene_type:complete